MRKKTLIVELPDGVPVDNSGKASYEADSKEFSVPDVATPNLADRRDANVSRTVLLENNENSVSTRSDMMSRERQNLVLVIAVVTLALALTAVLRLYSPKESMPLCAEQPEWNQYNCRAR